MGGGQLLNRNAFTLIELLAIIVILAIIAVITVPIILNIIDNSRRGAAKDSAYGYKDSINKWYVSKLSENPNYNITDGEYKVGELGEQVEGKVPGDNSWYKVTKNEVTDACLQFDEYKVEISSGKVGDAVKGECTGSVNSSVTQYGYKSFDTENEEETEIMIGTSGYIVTGKPAYLKYALTNGEVAEGTVPEACIYSDTYDGELCLKNNEFETSKQKILDYLGYTTTGEDAWTNTRTNTSGSAWENSTQTITCVFRASSVDCNASVLGAHADTSGHVNANSISADFGCSVYGDGSAVCDY